MFSPMLPFILRYRRIIIIVSQLCLLALAYLFSFLLRFDFDLEEPYRNAFLRTLPIVLAVKTGIFMFFRLFRGWWRFSGMADLHDIIKAAVISSLFISGFIFLTMGFVGFPRSVLIIDLVLTILAIGGVRFAVRTYQEAARIHETHLNTLIVGAGRAGTLIARELKSNEKLEYNLIGFIDDDPLKRKERIQGIRVLGNTDELPALIGRYDIAHILIAAPSASGRQIQRIVEQCRKCNVDFKTLPAMADIIDGSISVGSLRSVRVEDLMFREPVKVDTGRIRERLQGRVLFITGAGGSIGSELVRQVARFGPAKLVLYDQSENDLHRVDLELAEMHPRLKYVTLVGDILDSGRLEEVFAEHRPASVFHAAAYKHVPMMEKNAFQALLNNVFGTHRVASAAIKHSVEDFVLISSDKAVNPCNIMGVTKRMAEILVLALQGQSTRFVAVRFGNVLGSKGSAVPLFEEQIARRRAVTVTHPEATRYFMTISEAVQLVLQASTMGNGGEIFVLDMGEPIRVVDLARNLIRLSGLEPEVDVPIVFTGLRPGEKLVEELKLVGEGIKPTTHKKIHVLDGGRPDLGQVEGWLGRLAELMERKDRHGLVETLQQIVPEYTPSADILSNSHNSGT